MRAHPKSVPPWYTSGKRILLFRDRWTRLPAAVEYKDRLRKQNAMANRLSTMPKSKARTLSRLDNTDRMALEKFNPFSPHQTNVRNYAARSLPNPILLFPKLSPGIHRRATFHFIFSNLTTYTGVTSSVLAPQPVLTTTNP